MYVDDFALINRIEPILCCPRPDEIVKMYNEGHSLDYLTDLTYASKVFSYKRLARDYVSKCVYEYLMLRKITKF